MKTSMQRTMRASRPPAKLPALLLGIGLGGFIDGIALHQVLQWHHMVSDTHDYPVDTLHGLEANTLADGLFHALAWIFVLGGMTLSIVAWRQGRLAPTWRFHIGLLLTGWGLFNFVEGIINHQMLDLHHLRDDLGGPLSWDIAFLTFGLVLLIGGWLLHRSDHSASQLRLIDLTLD